MQIERRELFRERKPFAKRKTTLRCESKAGPILALRKEPGESAPGPRQDLLKLETWILTGTRNMIVSGLKDGESPRDIQLKLDWYEMN